MRFYHYIIPITLIAASCSDSSWTGASNDRRGRLPGDGNTPVDGNGTDGNGNDCVGPDCKNDGNGKDGNNPGGSGPGDNGSGKDGNGHGGSDGDGKDSGSNPDNCPRSKTSNPCFDGKDPVKPKDRVPYPKKDDPNQ